MSGRAEVVRAEGPARAPALLFFRTAAGATYSHGKIPSVTREESESLAPALVEAERQAVRAASAQRDLDRLRREGDSFAGLESRHPNRFKCTMSILDQLKVPAEPGDYSPGAREVLSVCPTYP